MSNENRRLVVRSGNVFDAITGTVKEHHTIVVRNNKIDWVGDDSEFEKQQEDKILDVTGKTILPGMIDCHLHLLYSATPIMEREYMRTKTDMYHFMALNHAQKHLISGFTCVRDCGSYPGVVPALRRVLDQGMFAGPRILAADQPVSQYGGWEQIAPDAILEFDKQYITKAGVDNVKQAIRERKASGADFIKTATTGGVYHGIEAGVEVTLWTDEELIAMREEAHRLGMHVAVHAHGREGIYRAVKAKLDTIEHGSFMDEETADLMIKNGTYLVTTQAAALSLVRPELLDLLDPESRQKTIEVDQKFVSHHKMAFEKGVTIAAGTDAGAPGIYHGESYIELKMLVEMGMTPAQALQTATINAAKAIWKDKQIGSLEQGKLADMVICNKNPTENIMILSDSQNLSHVIKDGKIMVEKGRIVYFSPNPF